MLMETTWHAPSAASLAVATICHVWKTAVARQKLWPGDIPRSALIRSLETYLGVETSDPIPSYDFSDKYKKKTYLRAYYYASDLGNQMLWPSACTGYPFALYIRSEANLHPYQA